MTVVPDRDQCPTFRYARVRSDADDDLADRGGPVEDHAPDGDQDGPEEVPARRLRRQRREHALAGHPYGWFCH